MMPESWGPTGRDQRRLRGVIEVVAGSVGSDTDPTWNEEAMCNSEFWHEPCDAYVVKVQVAWVFQHQVMLSFASGSGADGLAPLRPGLSCLVDPVVLDDYEFGTPLQGVGDAALRSCTAASLLQDRQTPSNPQCIAMPHEIAALVAHGEWSTVVCLAR